MIAGSISRRYARALMGIGVASSTYEMLGRELRDLADAMQSSPELAESLSHPAFTRADREGLLEAILKRISATKVTRNFTMLLLDHGRLAIIPDISRELDAMIDDKAGRVNAVVTSATKLSAMQVRQLKMALEGLSGKSVLMEQAEDPELLGGIVAKVGDIVYDGSLRSQLERMREGLA